MPSTATRSQEAAASATSPGPPAIARVAGPAMSRPIAITAAPIISASQDACTPSLTAASRRPTPKYRAARLVVPYSSAVPSSASRVITAPPAPSAASGTAPRWPTTAVSTSRKIGSAASTTKADTDSERIRLVETGDDDTEPVYRTDAADGRARPIRGCEKAMGSRQQEWVSAAWDETVFWMPAGTTAVTSGQSRGAGTRPA